MSFRSSKRNFSRPEIAAFVFRLLLFGVIWWIMGEGAIHSPLAAVLIVTIAAWTSVFLVPPGMWKFRFASLPGFLSYFLYQSLLGGIDVAGRALTPRMLLNPDVVDYRLTLEREASRIFFVWIVSLLPGTAGVFLEDCTVRIHVLDARQSWKMRLEELEQRIGTLFEPK
ncbi:MAG: Na+/H+ antiporter subunit E [Desulfovibrionales bacterium]